MVKPLGRGSENFTVDRNPGHSSEVFVVKKFIALGLLVAVVAAFKFLPWYVSVGLVVGALVLGKLVVMKLFKGFFMGLFAAKSAALKGASVQLHGITAAPEPKRDEDWEDLDDEEEGMESQPRSYRYVDLTITPANAEGAGSRLSSEEAEKIEEEDASDEDCKSFSSWDPADLALVRPDAKGGFDFKDDDDEDLGDVYDVAVRENGSWVPLEGAKLTGQHRIRLHIGVLPGHDQFKVKYYFEILKNAGSDA